MQDRIRDLEEQSTNQRAEAAKARREKEEIERKFNSKVYDLKVCNRQYSYHHCSLLIARLIPLSGQIQIDLHIVLSP